MFKGAGVERKYIPAGSPQSLPDEAGQKHRRASRAGSDQHRIQIQSRVGEAHSLGDHGAGPERAQATAT
ncbi:hypothetical protein RRG08_056199 [Elysia crispata]|uniref:Uncharacterized protein n=1 Tax=Elysia crispata TaxID=231223 RepID=A0AAE0YLW0_9GAST|nr:hypothetical protein RRG08_056199 [Elysia crispata]